MSDRIKRFEQGDTRQFTIAFSSAPSTPLFTVHAGSGAGTLINSETAATSNATNFYAFYTMPTSNDLYAYTWVASFTSGPVIERGWFQVIKTIPG